MSRTEIITNSFGESFLRERGPHGRICCADCHQPLDRGFRGIAYENRIIGGCCFTRHLAKGK